jgi:hypothetical protein
VVPAGITAGRLDRPPALRHRRGIFFFLPAVGPFIELTSVRGQIVVEIVSGWLFVRQWRRLRAREASGPARAEILPSGTPAATSPIPGTRRT